MQRFKNILYFADGALEPCPGLARAVSLAARNHARLTVFDVIKTVSFNTEVEKRLGVSMQKLLYTQRMVTISELVEPYQTPEQMIYTQVEHGEPFVEVIRAVHRNGFDLVIKDAHAATGLSDHIFGSTDLHLLRKCPCPVWIERPSTQQPYRKVLAAINPMHHDETAEDDTDHLVMQLAGSLAQREEAQLTILHAWSFDGESLLRSGRSGMAGQEVDNLVNHEKQHHQDRLTRFLNNYEYSQQAEVLLEKGDPASLILQHGKSADLIVMGTVGRSGIPGLIIGNTAEDVLQNTQASVLAVKPKGFRSPVVDAERPVVL